MRNVLILLAAGMLAGSCAQGKANDTVIVAHTAFKSVYAQSAHIPVLVTYTLHASDLDCENPVGRKAGMTADPLVPGTNLNADYKGSGYDKGHNMSSDDNRCSQEVQNECFYFTNMFPQIHELNAGIWLALERIERGEAHEYDSVAVFVGSYGVDKTIGPDKVLVPAFCWKVIYIPKLKEWDGYIFPNRACDGTPARYMEFTEDQEKWAKYMIRHYTQYRWP